MCHNDIFYKRADENALSIFFFFIKKKKTDHCTNYHTDSEMFGMHNNIMIQTRETHKFA